MKYRVWINGESCAFGYTGGDVLEIEDVYFIDCDWDTERLILDAMRNLERYGHKAEIHGRVKVERVSRRYAFETCLLDGAD